MEDKLLCIAVTHESVHSRKQLERFILDWQLQTNPDWSLIVVHDGPVTKEDFKDFFYHGYGEYKSPIKDNRVNFQMTPYRKKCWGAYSRIYAMESDFDHKYIFHCCVDDQIIPMFVETVLREFEADPNIEMLGHQICHWHYGHKPIPLGTWPAPSRADWCSFTVKTDLARKIGISSPEEFAADGIYMDECFRALGCDSSKMKILDNFLVVKN